MATIARISGGTTVSMLEDMVALLKKLNRSVESLQVVDSAQRQKVTIEAGTLPTVSTVSTVSNLGTINGVDPRYQICYSKSSRSLRIEVTHSQQLYKWLIWGRLNQTESGLA